MFLSLRAPKPPEPIIVDEMTVLLRPKRGVRRLTLRWSVKQDAFTLTTPLRASRKSALEFVQQNVAWMRTQQPVAAKIKEWTQGDTIPLEGIDRTIVHQDGAGVHVQLQDDTLLVTCRAARLHRAVERFVKQHAEHIVTKLVHEKSTQIGKRVSKITFRDTTSRWGSCSSSGQLSFSWRLIFAPLSVIDYVVAHEVAHLQHFDHSEKFWSLCRQLSAHYTVGKHWLQINGQDLHRY